MSESKSPELTQYRIDPGTTSIRIEGELDLASVGELRYEADSAINGGSSGLVIDLTTCEFIDSSVLALLVELRQRLNSSARARFAVVADAQPLEVIRITQLDREIPVFATADEAVNAVTG